MAEEQRHEDLWLNERDTADWAPCPPHSHEELDVLRQITEEGWTQVPVWAGGPPVSHQRRCEDDFHGPSHFDDAIIIHLSANAYEEVEESDAVLLFGVLTPEPSALECQRQATVSIGIHPGYDSKFSSWATGLPRQWTVPADEAEEIMTNWGGYTPDDAYLIGTNDLAPLVVNVETVMDDGRSDVKNSTRWVSWPHWKAVAEALDDVGREDPPLDPWIDMEKLA